MPPKKMSEAEKAALLAAQEEEERLALEAEIKRLEDERLAKEEEERRIKAEQIEFRSKEVEALAVEASAGFFEAADIAERLELEQNAKDEADAWAKHLACFSLPDASKESEVNTYISIAETELPTDLGEALTGCLYTEALASEVMTVMADADARREFERVKQCEQLCRRMRETSKAKLDTATLHIVSNADEFVNADGLVLLTEGRGGLSVGIWANVNTKSFRGALKPLAFKGLPGAGLQVDIPKQLNVLKVALRVCHFPYDDKSSRLSSSAAPFPFLCVGGTVEVEVFFLPPPPKQVKGSWLLRPANVQTAKLTAMRYGESHGPGAILTPLKVHFKVDPKVFLVPGPSERKVVRWAEAEAEGDTGGAWSEEGVSEVHFHADTRELVFSTQRSGVFALVGSRTACLPYVGWSLSPAVQVKAADSEVDIEMDEEGCIHLTLQTKVVENISIQIRAGVCQLLEPKIEGLHLKELEPGELLYELRACGVNLMPLDTDAGSVDMPLDEAAKEAGAVSEASQKVVLKSVELEKKAYAEMAAVASSFDMTSSRWNRKLGRNRSAFRVRETSVYTGGNLETFEYGTALLQADTESESYRLAPEVGDIKAPAMKCSLVVQGEAVTPKPTPPPPPEPTEQEAAAAAAAAAELTEEEAAEKAEAAAAAAAEEVARPWVEEFAETRVKGTSNFIFLKNLLKTKSSEETMERVGRTAPRLSKTIEELLTLVRPVAFS
mmetsp:Transcript_45228/g.89000  ORF Transcript_45228/g.89000 Transcript_45228/m.89000 type:complete len:724 (-) Transcript_45228:118-2289(-)